MDPQGSLLRRAAGTGHYQAKLVPTSKVLAAMQSESAIMLMALRRGKSDPLQATRSTTAHRMEPRMIAKIDRPTLAEALRSGTPPTLVEALPERYFLDAHLPGALNMPHDAVDALAPALLPDRQADIVVYCASAQCRNSDIAAERLQHLGYAKVRVYTDGKKDWVDAGLAVESGPAQRRAA
jgi:rhodanese-related sulfurtransferase